MNKKMIAKANEGGFHMVIGRELDRRKHNSPEGSFVEKRGLVTVDRKMDVGDKFNEAMNNIAEKISGLFSKKTGKGE